LAGEFVRGEVGQDELLRLMGGGDELVDLARELDALMQADEQTVEQAATSAATVETTPSDTPSAAG
jgi:hypothetical protein